MSIQSEIERISQAKTDIHSAIESKGVTVPDDALISEMAPYIQQIREAGTVVTSVSYIEPDESGNVQLDNLTIYCGDQSIRYDGGAEQILTINPEAIGAATAEQGALADTAVQPAQIAKFITAEDIPDELPNPYALSIQLNGGSTTAYDGSATRNVNITAAAIGAATSSDLEELEPLVGTTSNTTPVQVYNALSNNKQCFITDSALDGAFSSWIYSGDTYNGSVISNTTYLTNGMVVIVSLIGHIINGVSSWSTSSTNGFIYSGDFRSSENQFLTAIPSEGLVLEEVSATSIGAAPTMHSVADTTYGVGTQNYYGHVKLSDSTSSTSGQTSGVAATPLAVSQVNEKIPITHKVNLIVAGWNGTGGGDKYWRQNVGFDGITSSYEVVSITQATYESSDETIPDTEKKAAATWTYVETGPDRLYFYSKEKPTDHFSLIVTCKYLD